MFRSIRIFSIVLTTLVVMLSVLCGDYAVRYATQHLIMEPLTATSQHLYTIYVNNMWKRYGLVVEYLDTIPQLEWQGVAQYHTFTEESSNYLTARNLLKAQIFSPQQQLIFDSKKSLELMTNSAFLNSVFKSIASQSPGVESIFIQDWNIKNGEATSNKYIASVALPLGFSNKDAQNGSGTGALILYFDVNEIHHILRLARYLVPAALLLVLAPITLMLFFASRRVEELLALQQISSAELAQAKALAESESKAKSQFLANVSHELRTPLNAIIGFSEMINSEAMGSLNNPQYKEFVRDIHASGVHLLGLINDILDFAKADENKFQIVQEPIDITKLMKICVRMMAQRAENGSIQIIDEVPSEHIVIMGDAKRLKQIALNLLSNALKFTPQGGNVRLSLMHDITNKVIIIEIADTGIGMAAQDLATALSPFGQVENAFSNKVEGTGLGLPLTKKLVELMSGKFNIQSTPGAGTTVTIVLPAIKPPE